MTDQISIIFAALADPTRRKILSLLIEDDMAVTDVAAPFDMSLAAISKHIRILEKAGLITREKRGRLVWCKLEPSMLYEASLWLESFGLISVIDYDDVERFVNAELSEGAPPPTEADE